MPCYFCTGFVLKLQQGIIRLNLMIKTGFVLFLCRYFSDYLERMRKIRHPRFPQPGQPFAAESLPRT